LPVIFNNLTDINHRFVHKTPLHKLLNCWGKTNAHVGGAESKRVDKVDMSLGRRAYPAFVLNLSCRPSDYDISFEATKTYVEFKVLLRFSLHVSSLCRIVVNSGVCELHVWRSQS
jgi:hypothetical protein